MKGISVIVCTYNGVERLTYTLSHIAKQIAQCPWELIVVDNASTDNSETVSRDYLSGPGGDIKWRIVSEQKPGLNHARSRGLHESLYDVVLFCDDDNALAEDYIQVGFEILSGNRQIGALGGCGIPVFDDEKPIWFDHFSHSFAVGPQSTVDGPLTNTPAELYGAGTFFRKAPLMDLFEKGFMTIMTDRAGSSLTSGGDVEWCYMLQLAGYEIWYNHRLTFTHTMPASRMQWSYYLRLKQGIASGAAHLMPYVCLLKQREMGLISFATKLITATLLTTARFVKHKLRLLMKSGVVRPEDELALVILWSKTTAYWVNAGKALKHFRQIKVIV